MSGKEGPVLVVDDNLDTNEALVRLLSLHGHRAVSAYDGQEALDYLHEGNRPVLIVLDVRMPIVDGETFRTLVRADPDLAEIPIVVYSAVDAPEGLDEAPYVRKGIEPERVIELIDQFCAKRVAAG